MICPQCGSAMSEDYAFCTRCGARLIGSAPVFEAEPGGKPGRKGLIIALVILLVLSLIFTALLALGVISLPGSETAAEPERDLYAATPEPEAAEPVAEGGYSEVAEEEPETGYILPDSGERRLTESDIKDLGWERLCLARNEIYARHGLIFGVKEIDDYFLAQSWYTPLAGYDSFSFDTLSSTEAANALMMYDYEIATYGKTYY